MKEMFAVIGVLACCAVAVFALSPIGVFLALSALGAR